MVDIPRPPSVARARRIRRIVLAAAVVVAVGTITVGLAHLKPAAPTFDRATVWIDAVRRGTMVRNVRGPGVLTPEEIRWIPAVTAGRVERILIRPGATVAPETVIIELSNPSETQALAEAEMQLHAAEAGRTSLQARIENEIVWQQAWQRLMRVVGHEINNSLAPIKSIAASLAARLSRGHTAEEADEDIRRGLEVIASRAEALNRFTAAYSRLAKLPPPRLRLAPLGPLVRRAVSLETRLAVEVCEGSEVDVLVDPDQIEQALINLVKNAADAALETGGGVRVGWRRTGGHVDIRVEDEGAGLVQTANLFVPFFTTKPGGSGIGLVVSRQIVEAHGGSLGVENRTDRPGCVATLRLPVAAHAASHRQTLPDHGSR